MKNLKVLFLFIFISVTLFAQEKKYLSYRVKSGENMRIIAKDLGISTRDLLNLNPDVGRKPDYGTVIIIPNKNFGKESSSTGKLSNDDSVEMVKYHVNSKETMYGISKQFGITMEELLNANPDLLSNGLKSGMTLSIPQKKNNSNENDGNFISHLVVKDDTLYKISKDFGVTQEALLNLNPELIGGLKLGTTIRIPKNETISSNNSEEKYLMHIVEKGNTMYGLSKLYNVAQSDLLNLNPELKDGLKLGMQVKIKTIENNGTVKNDSDNESNVVAVTKIPRKLQVGFLNEHINTGKHLKVAFMLPYELNKLNDSIRNSGFTKPNSLLNIVTEFNLGANMAIDSLRQIGATIEINYFDTENSIVKIQKISSTSNFMNSDLAIGPLYVDNALWLAEHKNIPVFAPFYSKKQTNITKPNLIKMAADANFLTYDLLTYLKQKYTNEHIVLISDDTPESVKNLAIVLRKLKEFYPDQNIAVIKPQKGYISNSVIASKLSNSKENWVILVSDESITTAAAVNNLKMLSDKYNISLISLDNGDNFDTVENNYLAQLKFTFPTTEFLDTDNPDVLAFREKYYLKNNSYPSKYAIRGFDVTYDALVRLLSYSNLSDALSSGKSIRNESYFNFVKSGNGSYENDGVFIIQYDKNLNPVILN